MIVQGNHSYSLYPDNVTYLLNYIIHKVTNKMLCSLTWGLPYFFSFFFFVPGEIYGWLMYDEINNMIPFYQDKIWSYAMHLCYFFNEKQKGHTDHRKVHLNNCFNRSKGFVFVCVCAFVSVWIGERETEEKESRREGVMCTLVVGQRRVDRSGGKSYNPFIWSK